MKKVFLFFVLFAQMYYGQEKGRVIKVKDGDTIVLLLEGNVQKTIRLAEVDCPESGQAFGKNAKQFTSSQVFGKNVTYYETDVDRYGRSIAKIYYDKDKYLSEELIKAGMGWWYYQYSKNKSLGKYEEVARKQKVGLWQDKYAMAPWDYRKEKRAQSKAKAEQSRYLK